MPRLRRVFLSRRQPPLTCPQPPIASKRAKRMQGYVSDSDSDLEVPRISRLSKGKGKARGTHFAMKHILTI
ncbi:hypothetical protein PLICRDRAFT_55116 [Plicaturopsis crispa FD-325 SS-3]|nr:hypothetical protein PLICRDRAFT_55116 [Plicaturopsis crispa FD-325 SS-3]